MSKTSANSVIRLRGVRHNNLKNFDLDLPLNQLIVVTGLSGSGKSSLAFDTLFAEGQRRYVETFSPYARQFFDRMDKPKVDSIEGIPPAIAIEQRNAVKSTRSTVGTMTEICDYVKLLWPHIAQLHCRQCGQPVRKDSPQQIWQTMLNAERGTGDRELLITFDLPLAEKISLEESLGLITRQGYQRLLLASSKTEPADTPRPAPFGRVRPSPAAGTIAGSRVVEDSDVSPDVSAPEDGRTPNAGSTRRGRSSTKETTYYGTGGEQSLALNEATAPWGNQETASSRFEIVRIDEAMARLHLLKPSSLTVVQDRIKLTAPNRARFVEACEQAYHFGKGKLSLHFSGDRDVSTSRFSNRLHCADCDIEYREPSPALFSFNHPLGACPACRGFGRIIGIDYDLAVPDRTKTLAEGVVKPWLTGHGLESQRDLMKFCKLRKVPTDVPFEKLPRKLQDWVIHGDPDYGKDEDHEWPRAWYGVKGYFRWLESKAYKMHVRVLLSRYRSYTRCADCAGKRFQPEALLYQLPIANHPFSILNSPVLSLADFYQLPIRDALRLIDQIASKHHPKPSAPLGLVLNEVRSRLGYLVEVGLGYLALDRPTRTLSGGETERVNLTTCLGTRLVNTLYVLDEPSVGLHPRDTERLIRILEELRDLGNTVVVVEHEAGVIRAADQIVDLGPGHGESGGQLVFQGSYRAILKSKESLTGQYLSGRKQVEVLAPRPVHPADDEHGRPSGPLAPLGERGIPAAFPGWLRLEHASLHNLKDLTLRIPLARFVCVTGVSGSGKTTLIREVLLPALQSKLKSRLADQKASDRMKSEDENEKDDEDESPSTINHQPSTAINGWEPIGNVVLVDHSALGKTPRSNPAVYLGAFDEIREFFAQTDAAKQRGLNASAFSFNSAQGQCERCRGAGFEKIEMQFLSDVFIRCPDCDGRRYRPHILEVKVERRNELRVEGTRTPARKPKLSTLNAKARSGSAWSIADLLDATVDEAIVFLSSFSDSRPAQRAAEKLKLLQEVGLGYLRLGQPINTLSGGESQRLKLVSHLVESVAGKSGAAEEKERKGEREKPSSPLPPFSPAPFQGQANATHDSSGQRTLFLFDEPTTGLHFDDVRVLLKVFQRLVDAGHSVIVIEHNLDVIKCADWVIDLGPEAGDEGGRLVAQGTPEDIAACGASYTGQALKDARFLAAHGRNPFAIPAQPR